MKNYEDMMAQLVKNELLPVYLRYHKENHIETPKRVLELIDEIGLPKPQQIPALLKPPKNSI